MAAKVISAGFVIWCPSGLLLGHVTGASNWDLPKGNVDPGEASLAAAVRELREETSLILRDGMLIAATTEYHVIHGPNDLGCHPYTRKKDLHLFQLVTEHDIDTDELACTSMVVRPAYSFPEIDRFKLFPPRDVQRVTNPALYDWLKAHVKLP